MTENATLLKNVLESDKDPIDAVNELAFGMKTKLLKRKRKDPKKSRAARMAFKKSKGKIKRGLAKFRKSSKGKALMKKLARFNKGRARKSSFTPAGMLVMEQVHQHLAICSELQYALSEYQLAAVQEEPKTPETTEYPCIEDILEDLFDLTEINHSLSQVAYDGFNETEDAEDVEGLLQDATDFLSDYDSED